MSNLLTKLGRVYRDYYFEVTGRKGGYITQEERDRARKRNRKKIDILPHLKIGGFLATSCNNACVGCPLTRSLNGLTPTCQFVDAPTKNIIGCMNVTLMYLATLRTYPFTFIQT